MDTSTHYVNATGSTIKILDDDGEALVILPPDELRRGYNWEVEFQSTSEAYFAGNGATVPIGEPVPKPTKAPDPLPNVVFIVRRWQAECWKATGRPAHDLLVPYDDIFSPADNAIIFTRFIRP